MLIHLAEGKTVTMHAVDLLLPLGVGPSEHGGAPPAKKGQGRRARGRRPGMLSAVGKSGEERPPGRGLGGGGTDQVM